MKFYTIMNVKNIYIEKIVKWTSLKKMELSIIRCLANCTAEALFYIGYEYNYCNDNFDNLFTIMLHIHTGMNDV